MAITLYLEQKKKILGLMNNKILIIKDSMSAHLYESVIQEFEKFDIDTISLFFSFYTMIE